MSKQGALWDGRRLVWFSCGAASAVAAKLAVERYGAEAEVINCDTSADEHPDNVRFRRDVGRWIGQEIKLIRSAVYAGVDDVIAKTGYMSGPQGARCTVELKKVPRFAYQGVGDIHLFGFTADEGKRIASFERDNPELNLEWILRDRGITKADCFAMLERSGIKRSAIYDFGFNNANCLGCVKATSPKYWGRVREHFPGVFAKRCRQSRALGVRLIRVNGERAFLDELPAEVSQGDAEPDIECGPQCVAEAA